MVHCILNTIWLHVRTKIRYTWLCTKLRYILEPKQLINFKFLVSKIGVSLRFNLTLTLLTWRIWWAPNNASKWQMGFNSAYKGLSCVLQGRDQAWALSLAFNTFIQITLLKVFKLIGAKTINVFSVKLYIHRLTTVLVYRYAPHNDVSVNDGPHIRRWSH